VAPACHLRLCHLSSQSSPDLASCHYRQAYRVIAETQSHAFMRANAPHWPKYACPC
jgi:hypothetical protein